MKKIAITVLCMLLFVRPVAAQGVELSAKAAILAEQSTGEILYEQNSRERLPMASVTKIMTLLLGIEAVESGRIRMDDLTTVSEYASSMTGSRVFLSVNEQISVEDLLKSIAVASGNDAAVALAELIAGDEANFVTMMNERAAELGLEDTHFANCNGLPTENHYSSAYDLMCLSRELLCHDAIRPFLTIWMDSLRNGTFTLSNTNKLIRFYDGATGIKTGSTNEALYCVSASAMRDGMELIAVVLGAPTSKQRFADASALLNLGFASRCLETGVREGETVAETGVEKGIVPSVGAVAEESFTKVVPKEQKGSLTRTVTFRKRLRAPIGKGEPIGRVRFFLNDEEVGSVALVSECEVKRAGFLKNYVTLFRQWVGC